MPGAEAPSEPMNAATGGARPRVTVVIPSYNGERLLPGCLDALARQADNALDHTPVNIPRVKDNYIPIVNLRKANVGNHVAGHQRWLHGGARNGEMAQAQEQDAKREQPAEYQ